MADGAAAVIAGAEALHVHPRDGRGRESVAGPDVAAALTALRDLVRVPIGMPIGAGPLGAERRLDAVRRWPVRPDVASVRFDEEGAAELAAGLLDQAVGVEASVATPEAAEALLRSGLASRSHRIAIAPRDQDLAAACATVHAIEQVLDGAAPGVPRLLHGTETTAWGLVAEAGRRGYDVRMGLEDTTRLPDGMVAHDNGELIRTALAVHRAAEIGSDLVARRPATAPGAPASVPAAPTPAVRPAARWGR